VFEISEYETIMVEDNKLESHCWVPLSVADWCWIVLSWR